jgi:phospholipase/carboxylesterase
VGTARPPPWWGLGKPAGSVPPTTARSPLTAHVEPADGDPVGLLVLVHGFGHSETYMGVAGRLIDPQRRFVVAAPQGPILLPTSKRRAWVLPKRKLPEQFAVSLRELDVFVDAQCAAHGVERERVVLGGFSQGAILALALATWPSRPVPAAVISWCGVLPLDRGVDVDVARLHGVPVLCQLATRDEVISVGAVRAATQELRDVGAVVTAREYDARHEVTLDMLVDARAWLAGLDLPR